MHPPPGQDIPGTTEPSAAVHDLVPADTFLQRCKAWRPVRLAGRLADVPSTLLYWAISVLFLWLCHWSVTHHPSARALAVFSVLCAVFLAYGRLFIQLAPSSFRERAGLSIQFLCGYLLSNTLLFALTLATPFGIVANTGIVAICGLPAFFIRNGPAENSGKSLDLLPDLLCLLLCVTAASLWCADSLNPVVKDGPNTIFRLWQDSFFHAREISIFAQAHGLRTISDMRMAGVPAPVYHYASYAMPAAVRKLTGSSAFDVFAGFQVPMGMFLSGLAAFGLAAAVWGEWPGLAAAGAVLLMRDAYEQGFANKFLSYNFMQLVGVGGLYGVSCVAVAWMCVLLGCACGEWSAILLGYAIALATVAYKAHLFVANAFLVMLYPWLFFKRLAGKWRFILGLFLSGAFFAATSMADRSQSIPTLRLDGSGIPEYANLIAFSYDRGFLRSLCFGPLTLQQEPHWIRNSMLALMILLSTFGLWLLACPFAGFLARKRTPAAALFLPLFIVANYLVMSLGLAMDSKNIANREELLHRPFVWACFVVAAWTGGAAYAGLNGNRPPGTRFERFLVGALVLAGLTVPAEFGHNIQTLPASGIEATYKDMNSVPTPLVKACLYIRGHSKEADVIQDSENDGRQIVTGLAERQDFASCPAKPRGKVPVELTRRLGELALFEAMTDEASLQEFARKTHISWVILEPSSNTAWPASFLNSPVFQSGEYRVYHFNP